MSCSKPRYSRFRVVMTKGTIVLRGARLEVRQTPEGYQAATVTAEAGQRAFFRQKRDVAAGQPEEYVEGEGRTIEYDGRSDTVKLRQRAQLRRYRGRCWATRSMATPSPTTI